jgi:hypothetical protein
LKFFHYDEVYLRLEIVMVLRVMELGLKGGALNFSAALLLGWAAEANEAGRQDAQHGPPISLLRFRGKTGPDFRK